MVANKKLLPRCPRCERLECGGKFGLMEVAFQKGGEFAGVH